MPRQSTVGWWLLRYWMDMAGGAATVTKKLIDADAQL